MQLFSMGEPGTGSQFREVLLGVSSFAVAALLLACSGGSSDGGAQDPMGGSAGVVGTGGTSAGMAGGGAGPASGGSGLTGGVSGGAGGPSPSGGNAGGGSGGSPVEARKPLLEGEGVEYRGIVNLVGQEVTDALERFLLNPDTENIEEPPDLDIPTRLFYSNYSVDDYDFLYFITADELPGAIVAGLHQGINNPGRLGTGQERPFSRGLGPPRLNAAIGIVGAPDRYPSFAHELLHTYAVHLDDSLGFPTGDDVDFIRRHHWGLTSVQGQHGGFDASSLRCETPADVAPPGCTPTAMGRYRYVLDPFLPNTVPNKNVPFAPMELYLMGLLPRAEVPSPILQIAGANVDPASYEVRGDGKVVIEGTGITEITLESIVKRHGEVPVLPADKRHVRAGFVLVTRTAATQVQLDRVADWAAAFAGELELAEYPNISYAAITGGRGTLSYRVGAQRALGPDDYLDFSGPWPDDCDHLLQDCGGALSCYGTSVGRYCAVPGSLPAGEVCSTDSDCLPNLVCALTPTALEVNRCAPYCNHLDPLAVDACDVLCPNAFTPIYHGETLEELGAHCFGGAGGVCNPLGDDCEQGLACSGWDPPGCHLPGDLPLGAQCSPLEDLCVPGTTCIAVQGSDNRSCQPYCDNVNPTAANGCETLCGAGAFQFDAFGICIPN
jgi:hypothetical protein